MDCCIHTQATNAYFDERKARGEVAQFLKKSLASHARAMLEAVNAQDAKATSLLDAYGGRRHWRFTDRTA